jgi:ABC-type bacteriocin/lantibiotic exporter with double-glycine peptidase domain
MTPEALQNAALPLIAHCEEEKTVTGHYVVVTATNGEQVEFIDGTTAILQTQAMAQFRKSWSGYVLAIDSRPRWNALSPLAVAFGAASLLLVFWLKRRGCPGTIDARRPLPRPRATVVCKRYLSQLKEMFYGY